MRNKEYVLLIYSIVLEHTAIEILVIVFINLCDAVGAGCAFTLTTSW